MQTTTEIHEALVQGFRARKFSAGLLVAFIDFLIELDVPGAGFHDLAAVLERYPRQETTAQGKRANTLIVRDGDRTLSIRPFYNDVERFFRAEKKRFDFPSCAPHATQAWSDYIEWWDVLVSTSREEIQDLRDRVVAFVLEELESHEFDPSTIDVEPPLFARVLEDFELTRQQGEPTGAAFQGIVFGFLRADNPHLQVETQKVRTGSKRLQRVGDVDCWDGARLAISAEVKQYPVPEADVPDFEAFGSEAGRRGALGLVVALDFEEQARPRLTGLGLKPLDADDLLEIVELWDPVKQRIAAMSFVYYATHVEKNAALSKRLLQFLEDVETAWREARSG